MNETKGKFTERLDLLLTRIADVRKGAPSTNPSEKTLGVQESTVRAMKAWVDEAAEELHKATSTWISENQGSYDMDGLVNTYEQWDKKWLPQLTLLGDETKG